MALSKRHVQITINDKNQGGPVDVFIETIIITDAPEAVALGGAERAVTMRCVAPRAAALAFIATVQVVDDGKWPEGLIALPFPRAP